VSILIILKIRYKWIKYIIFDQEINIKPLVIFKAKVMDIIILAK